MGKKILILNGSPRANGNTSSLIKEFKRGAEESGNEVTEFLIDRMNINYCKSCYCGTKDMNAPCIQKDDMSKIYPEYVNCDVVVFASPLYYWNISAQLKIVVDRFFGIAECYPHLANPVKDSVLLMAAEGDEFDSAVDWYERFCKNVKWKILGEVLCPFVEMPGDTKGKKELESAYNLGKSIK